MTKITFIDRPCGTGKTTDLIDDLKQWNPDTHMPVLVVTPRLSEVQRIVSGAHEAMLTVPEGNNKTIDIEGLLKAGANIVCTHALYIRLEHLALAGLLARYRLVIDECPTPLEIGPAISKRNFQEQVLDTGFANVDPFTRKVTPNPLWLQQMTNTGLTGTLGRLLNEALRGRLFVAEDGRPIVLAIPTALLTAPSSLTILTYLTEGSMIAAYLNRIGAPYDVQKWAGEEDWVRAQRDLITVETMELPVVKGMPMKLTHSGQTNRLPNGVAKTLGSKLRKMYFNGPLRDTPKENIMITCAANLYFDGGADKRRKASAMMKSTGLYGRWTETDGQWKVKGGLQWVANQTRGINDYINCSHAFYLYDQHPNPVLCSYLQKDADKWGEQYALTELVQWLYRSRVRVGEPVTVYVPSDRMRRILTDWLNSAQPERLPMAA
ncbi:hypothetical protein [uncultured Ruegeria sp.]|uniref:hypothetical protein n=1 Tax=uncultured Ruegeria sp. TaxID=259304 RepID=UPI00261ABE22|nr:hypothetical protein [uncultured Ruegeria sp.]